MQTKNECKNCTESIPYGVDSFGKPIFRCKNIFCIFNAVTENIYHEISIKGIDNDSKNT